MIDYTGFGEKVLTFKCTENTNAGDLVKICENDTVCPASSGEAFSGVALSVRNGFASVATDGFVNVTYTGTAPALGEAAVAANGTGGVTASLDGKKVTVLRIDTIQSTVGFIF